jgi:hypothetical protein
MARPQKQATDKRPRVVSFRMTEEEHARLEAKAREAGQPIGEYARQAAEGGRIVARVSRVDFALTDQIRRLGVNLNQIAKHVNAGRSPPVYLERLCARVEAMLERLFDEEGGGRGPTGG